MIKKSLGVSILSVLALGPPGSSADKVPRVHALTGARIVVSAGEIIATGTIVLRDGIIAAVGSKLEPPPDARVHELEGLTIYPGLIDPYTVQSWPQTEADEVEPRQAGHENDLVTPERDMTHFAVNQAAARKLREAGFTTAVVAPKEGLFRGRSVLINLGEGSANNNIVKRRVAQNVTLRSNTAGGDFPASP